MKIEDVRLGAISYKLGDPVVEGIPMAFEIKRNTHVDSKKSQDVMFCVHDVGFSVNQSIVTGSEPSLKLNLRLSYYVWLKCDRQVSENFNMEKALIASSLDTMVFEDINTFLAKARLPQLSYSKFQMD